jgi:hypothetical protein
MTEQEAYGQAYENGYAKGYTEGKKDAMKAINNTPTVDAVEVVRCKDCGRGDQYANRPPYIYCMEHSKLVDKDDFCSYGERKTDV